MYLIAMIAFAGAEPPAERSPDFRLAPAARGGRILPERCPGAGPGEIVVCGRNDDRLGELKPPPGIKKREEGALGVDVGGGRLGPTTEEVEMPGGRVSKRILMRFKLPF